MTRLYAAWNTPFVTLPCALGEAVDDMVRLEDTDTPPEYRRAVRVNGWRLVKFCLHCGDEYPPGAGYGGESRDYCTQVCHDEAARLAAREDA